MGFFDFLRTSGLVFISIIFGVLLIIFGTFLTLGFSISYENIQKTLPPILKQVLLNGETPDQIDESVLQMQMYCNQTNSDGVMVPINNSYFLDLIVPCSEVYNGKDSVVNYSLNEMVNEIYYKNYSCASLTDCIDEDPPYIVSNQFRKELMHYVWILFFVCLVCVVFVFLLARKKSNACFVLGGILACSSLLLLWTDKILSSAFSSFSGSKGLEPSSFVNIFFSSSTSVFLIFLLFGLAFIVSGIVIKFLASRNEVEDSSEDL